MRWSLRRLWLSLIGLLLLVCRTGSSSAAISDPWAPFDAPWFDKVSSAEGLPPSIITALAQDRQGLLWVGTMVGLARHDGYRTQVFDTRGGTNHGLPDAYVRCLLALPDGGLLIGTNAGGLVRFDPASNDFHPYPVGTGGTSDRKIYALADDHAGGVWIATEHGLDHLDLRSNVIHQLKTGGDTAPRNFSAMQDRAGNLWLGNNNGLFVRHAGSRAFVRPDFPEGTVATVLDNQIWAIHEDKAGGIWVGSGQAGAVYRDSQGQWHPIPGFSGYQDSAQHPTVRDFIEEEPGKMWIATDGAGLLAYAPGDAGTRQIHHDPAIDSSLPGDVVRALLRDRSGNIWAATDLGLARTRPDTRTVFSILPSPLERNTLSDTSVRGIYVDSRQLIWLGLGSGRIDMIDLKHGRMNHLQLGGSQVHRDTQSFVEAADGSIWVGTQGLARIDPATLKISPSVLPALENVPVLSLNRDGSRLLIGTYDGVYRYDTVSHVLDHIAHDPHDPTSLIGDTVRQIAHIDGKWWYSTASGISIADNSLERRGFHNLRHHDDDPTSLPGDSVGAVSTDAQGHVLVSSSGGLSVAANSQPWRFSTTGIAHGLASDKVNSALSDNLGHVWISTSSGISVIDVPDHAVYNLGPRDGLHISNYHYANAAARAPGGELLFGGLGGLTVVRPGWSAPPKTAARLAITNIAISDVALPFGKLPHDGSTITLNKRHHNLRVDFSLLDYQAPEETSYSYRMEGLDDNWISIPRGALPSANYTNLGHGTYRLHLRAVTHGMQPHTIESSLLVTVKPRWYETLASRIAAVLLLIALITGLVHLRTVFLRRQAEQLQRQINEHTLHLRAANQRLDELANTDGLTGVYNRRRFLELIREERAHAFGRSVCIALFDLDRFKSINDTYGHLAGDAVIRAAIEVIKQHRRQADLIGRYGGEEFVLCLPDTSVRQAQEIAERICLAIDRNAISYGNHEIKVTVSIGLADLRPGDSIEQWLSRADKALYEAKRSGRNRCAVAD
ncbi:MAG TPA: diguanylate cyclase [Rhodanobacter sp.]|nr:diguanylate cyclase [Rhodanobacter sp.]